MLIIKSEKLSFLRFPAIPFFITMLIYIYNAETSALSSLVPVFVIFLRDVVVVEVEVTAQS